MQDMGEIITYQDVEKSSAVVYVSKDKLLVSNVSYSTAQKNNTILIFTVWHH